MSKRLWPKAYAAVIGYLALSPLYLLPAAVLLPDRLWIAAALPLPALLLTGAAGLLPARRRAAALILGLLLMTALCLLLFASAAPLAVLLALPCAFTMLTFLPAMARPAHEEWSLKHLIAGIVLHLAGQLLKGYEVFAVAAAPLTWMFVVYLLAFLFSYNRSMLANTGPSAAKALLYQNRKLLGVFCLLALLLTNIKSVVVAIRAAILWIIQTGANLVTWLMSFFQPEEVAISSQGGFNPLEGLEEASEPNAVARILEILLVVIAALIAAVLLFFFFKHLYKLLRKAFHALMERLKLYRQRIAADYEDQSESLLDWGEIRKTAGARLHQIRNRLLPTPWEKLTPAQRVRRVYQLLLRRTDAPDPALTAREMLHSGKLRLPNDAATPAAALYDRARYSTHSITDQEADALRKQAGL